MTAFESDDDTAAVASVGELVNRRLSNAERWNLALVQRDEVWDELRMRHLLDSLLADYPIGAILLSSVRVPSRELVVEPDGSRTESDAAHGAWQVLDGQQRINAMFSIFTDQGNYGHFLLDMLTERPAPAPAQGRAAKARSLSHIRHVDSTDDPGESRERFVDLSRWSDWAARTPGLGSFQVTDDAAAELAHDLDPEFSPDIRAEEAPIVARNLQRLIRAWTKQSVPILRAQMDTPLDVLEVFSRINLGGVAVAGADVYFAGVKTFWKDAERRVDAVMRDAPVLRRRLDAVRFLSRLVSRGLGHGDPIPLTVDILAGPKGEVMRAGLEEITSAASPPRTRLRAFTAWYLGASELGYALRQVTPDLWDDVLAWAAASPRSDSEWYAQSRGALDSYLLGATLLRYRSVLGDPFRRIAFSEALDAGSKGHPFPLDEIVAVTHAKTNFRGSRGRTLLGVSGLEDRAALARSDGWMLTALAQRIPYELAPGDDFDWDHIFPAAQAHRMWSPGEAGRRRHHPDRHLVNATGNFWALNSSANRSLQDLSGRAKFERLLQWLRTGEGHRVWEETLWSISQDEIERFILVDEKLNGEPASIDQGMQIFAETVTSRSLRLLDDALSRFPAVTRMAGDADLPKYDPRPKPRNYRTALGLTVDRHSATDAEAIASADPIVARGLLRARARSLGSAIKATLREEGTFYRSWKWEPSGRGTDEIAFAGFELRGGNCIELMLRWTPTVGPRFGIKAYPERGQASSAHHYPEFSEVQLAVTWASPDDAIVEAFLAQVTRLERLHPRNEDGTRA